jgi:hypothetical protein
VNIYFCVITSSITSFSLYFFLWDAILDPEHFKLMLGSPFRGCLTGALRLYYIILICYHTYDVTWYGNYLYTLGIAETELTLICASAPALRPLLKKYRFGSSGSRPSDRPSYDPEISGGSIEKGSKLLDTKDSFSAGSVTNADKLFSSCEADQRPLPTARGIVVKEVSVDIESQRRPSNY